MNSALTGPVVLVYPFLSACARQFLKVDTFNPVIFLTHFRSKINDQTSTPDPADLWNSLSNLKNKL